MKKILSLALAAMMVVSVLPVTYAADVDYTAGTAVEYTADADANRSYTITVPAELQPGQSGTVTLKGMWASNETVKVTADASVELTNSINAADTKTLAITFAGIEKAGDNTVEKTYTESVSVAAMPADALFGTWSGKFNYNVEFDDGKQVNLITFIIDETEYQAEEGMTWAEWIESDYNTIGVVAASFQTDSGAIVQRPIKDDMLIACGYSDGNASVMNVTVTITETHYDYFELDRFGGTLITD